MLEKMTKEARSNGDKGFTLIELIVVIAILAILAAILVPSMMEYSNNARKATADTNARAIYSAATSVATMIVTSGGTVTPITAIPVKDGTGNLKSFPDGSFQHELAKALGDNFVGKVTVNVDSNGEITSTGWTDDKSTGSYAPNANISSGSSPAST